MSQKEDKKKRVHSSHGIDRESSQFLSNHPQQTQPTWAQIQFLSNIHPTEPVAGSSAEKAWFKPGKGQNYINGQVISEYKEYLFKRCNKLCSFKLILEFKQLYKKNKKIKKYIDENCDACIRKLTNFNNAVDAALESILNIDPRSPTANVMLYSNLLENGTAIFNALPENFQNELKAFEPLDYGDIETNDNSLLNQLELNLRGFIKREEIMRKGVNRFRRGGRSKTRRKTKRKTRRKTKRKTRRKTRRKTKRKTKRRRKKI